MMKIIRYVINLNPTIKKTARMMYSVLYMEKFRNLRNKIKFLFGLNDAGKLRKFKNIHLGESCFIVATGPSLKIDDLNKLKGIKTFSMNSIVLAYDQTQWRPDYYGTQDYGAYLMFKDELLDKDFKKTLCFIGDEIKNFPIKEKCYRYYLNLIGHDYNQRKLRLGFSCKIDRQVIDGFSISFSLLQIAVYMGFKNIFFLGLDADIPMEGDTHFIEYNTGNLGRGTKQGQIDAFRYSKSILERKGISVYNATRGGKLEVFPRVDFDKLVQDNFIVT